jgi:hypothetical protein
MEMNLRVHVLAAMLCSTITVLDGIEDVWNVLMFLAGVLAEAVDLFYNCGALLFYARIL